MRKRGFEVVCADDCAEARMLWHPAVYDLVLMDGGPGEAAANEELCHDMKSAYPKERVAFLVGKPELLASTPSPNGDHTVNPSKTYQRVFQELLTEACEVLPHRHGFMEAVWRMYLVKSARLPSTPARPPVIPVTTEPNLNPEPLISFGDAVRKFEREVPSQDDGPSA
ncbi:MAG: hypothetical protein ACR2IF_14675 [Terriglobales bacterium]